MKKNYFSFLAFLGLGIILTACAQPAQQDVTTNNTELTEEIETSTETPTSSKLSENATEINYAGSAQFVTKTQTIPCSEYAFDSEVCAADPSAEEVVETYYIQLPLDKINAELMSYLDSGNLSMVEKQEGSYLVNIGCKEGNKIRGHAYEYAHPLFNTAFETGTTYQVDFDLDLMPKEGSPACVSLISQFNSIK